LFPVTYGTECLKVDGNKIIVVFFTGMFQMLELNVVNSLKGKLRGKMSGA
jgi:hypothetical protein